MFAINCYKLFKKIINCYKLSYNCSNCYKLPTFEHPRTMPSETISYLASLATKPEKTTAVRGAPKGTIQVYPRYTRIDAQPSFD